MMKLSLKIPLSLFLCTNIPYSASVYKDFGQPSDFSTSEKMYFGIHNPDSSGIWYLAGPSFAPYHGAFFEDSSSFWWAGAPPRKAGMTSARTVMFRRKAVLHVRAIDFSDRGNLYLTVRFKDQCRPGVFPGVPVFSRVGDSAVLLGTLGGRDDKAWKTETLVIPMDMRRKKGGEYVLIIGTDDQDGVVGEFPVDKIKLSDNLDRGEFESDAAGLWPKPDSSHLRFSRIGRTQEFVPGQGPFFPFGFYSGDQISDGGSATSGGRGENDSWEIMERAHVNTYVVHGWEQNWNSLWRTFPREAPWASPGVRVEPGFRELLVQGVAHHIRLIPNTLTDTRAYWVQRGGGTPTTLRRLAGIATSYANNPNLLAYNPVDEFDHGDPRYAKPHLFVQQLFKAFKDNDPTRPIFMTLMGYMGSSSWHLAAETADILATDTYLDDYTGDGGLERGAELIASHLDAARMALGDSKAILYVGHFGEGPEDIRLINGTRRVLNSTEILFQGYLGIVHGAQGLLFFRFIHPKNPDYPNLNSTWEGFRQMGTELFGKGGIAPLMMPPSRTVDILGEQHQVSCDNANIHFILKMAGDGTRVLIAVNIRESDQKATFTVNGLERTLIPVHFENRDITASGTSFSDSFGRFIRHVYVLNGSLEALK